MVTSNTLLLKKLIRLRNAVAVVPASRLFQVPPFLYYDKSEILEYVNILLKNVEKHNTKLKKFEAYFLNEIYKQSIK